LDAPESDAPETGARSLDAPESDAPGTGAGSLDAPESDASGTGAGSLCEDGGWERGRAGSAELTDQDGDKLELAERRRCHHNAILRDVGSWRIWHCESMSCVGISMMTG